MKTLNLVLLSLPLVLIGTAAHADRLAVPNNALYQEECASCHMAYPPQMLDAKSWRELMKGLPTHFGTDASLDEKRRLTITDFLDKHAGGRKTGVTEDAKGKPLLRITETAYFARKHREVPRATYQRASIKSAANCTACHADAADGNYSDHAVRIPK